MSQKLERLNSPCDSLDSPSVNIHKDVVKNIKVLLKYFIIINNNIINYYYLLLFIITPLYFYKHNDENVMLTLACRARLQIESYVIARVSCLPLTRSLMHWTELSRFRKGTDTFPSQLSTLILGSRSSPVCADTCVLWNVGNVEEVV